MSDRLNRLIPNIIILGLILLVLAVSPFRVDPLYSIKEDLFTLITSLICFFGAVYVSIYGVKKSYAFLFWFLFVSYMAVSIIFAENKYEGFKESFRLFLVFSTAFTIYNLKDIAKFQHFITAGLVCAVIASLLGLLEYCGVKLLFAEEGKIISLFGHQNILAQYLAVSLAWSFVAVCFSPKLKFLHIISFIIICAGLFITTCRSAWLSCTLSISVIIFISIIKKQFSSKLKKMLFFIAIISGIILTVYIFVDTNKIHLKHGSFATTSFKDKFITFSPLGISSGRDILWKTSLFMFSKKPVTGYGAGNYWISYPAVDPPLVDFSKFVHNDYLQILTEGGLIGFGLFIVTLIYSIANIINFAPQDKNRFMYYSFLSSLFVILSDSFFSYDLYMPVPSYILAVAFGVLLNLSNTRKDYFYFNLKIVPYLIRLSGIIAVSGGILFFILRNVGYYNYFYGVMSITDNINQINQAEFTSAKIKKAQHYTRKALKFLPYEPEILFFDTMLLVGEGDFNSAGIKGEKLLKLTPYDKKALLIMAKIEAVLGNEGASKHYYNMLTPNNNMFQSKYITDIVTDYSSFYGKIHSDVFEKKSSVKMLDKISAQINQSTDVIERNKYLHYIRATMFINLGRWAEAIEDINICESEQYKQAYLMRAIAFSKTGDMAKAESDFSKYLEFDKKSEAGYLGRGIARLKMNKMSLAETDFNSVLLLNNKNYKALRNLGIIKLAGDDIKNALKYFKLSLLSNPNQHDFKEIEETINKLSEISN